MKNADNDREVLIKQLQILAGEVRELKEGHRQKRPIVIEFSGSPKAGKTSCINSLEIFLKRNGFRVEIIQERASVCPVANKVDPMFNVWTACMSISGMIGALEKKKATCDVLILDRGVFDALCWFHWLYSKNVFAEDRRKAVESFLVMDAFVKRIDIVFAFQVKPNISIDREYANLLTDKPGSIMNEKVLSEYLQSIKKTIEDKKDYFHNIFEMDTSDKTQDQVGKEVTITVLNTLKDMLMEKVGYFIPSDEIREKLNSKRIFEFNELVSHIRLKFDLRETVENADNSIQPLPIAVLASENMEKVFVIKKAKKATSNDSPEKDKMLLYIGGHSRLEDSTENTAKDLLAIFKYTLCREIKEEIGVELALNNINPFWIYTPDNPKSTRHIALCFLIKVDDATLKIRLDSEELVQNKGTSKSGRFHLIQEIVDSESLESWSETIADRCFGLKVKKSPTLFSALGTDNENLVHFHEEQIS
jgi:thymidylate kinase